MSTIICYAVFLYLVYKGFKQLYTPLGYLTSPYSETQIMGCTGSELLLIFIFTTGLLGIQPVLSLRLAILEVLCILGLMACPQKPVYSIPIILFFVFIGWTLIGIFYTPSPIFGIRMVLKYIYPLLVALLASAVVRNGEITLKSMLNARKMAFWSIILISLPLISDIVKHLFWNKAALATHYITIAIFSLALFYFSDEKKKNLIWFVIFCLPCLIWVFRTNIMGTMIALSAFFTIKYRFKALPIIGLLACLSIASIFYIPSVKEKMFFRPDEVTITDFLTNNVREDNINTSGRNQMWKQVMPFYEQNKMLGEGTGRVQKFFYTEIIGFGRGGQLHNDFLLMLCDNGLIGLMFFILTYIAIFIHCIKIYHRNQDPLIKLCAITSGASLLGVMVTMYSDNTVSYSMATLSYPWGLYGMVLGLIQAQKINSL